jgi:hypothetical protein
MTLKELFRRLSVGELSNIAMGATLAGIPTGTIDPNQQQKVVLYTNDGLNRLYTRFVIKESDLILEQQADQDMYPLELRHCQSQMEEFPGGLSSSYYIQDTEEDPFLDDIIKILRAYDGNGCEVPLDNPDDCCSWFRPQSTVLQIPFPVAGNPAAIVYQANHREMPWTDLNGEFELPDPLVPALRAYVASEVYSHMNTQEAGIKAQEHLKKFEELCVECLAMNLVTMPEVPMNHKFDKRGWI